MDLTPLPETPRDRLLARHPWLPFVLPFAVYMLVGSLEPAAPTADVEGARVAGVEAEPSPQYESSVLGIRYEHYPIIYTAKIVLTIAAMWFVAPGYGRRFRISPLAPLIGIVGVVLWIWICSLHLEPKLLDPLGLGWIIGSGERPAYNPLEQLAATPIVAYAFLAIRFLGLAVIVPIIEEFFLRGFVMRFATQEKWWEVPFGTASPTALVAGTLVPMLMHPAELLAAAVWFSLVTWLMLRTKNIWDCVAAHAVTNLLLGIYVVTFQQWQLW
jgi:CAAX protease family protein